MLDHRPFASLGRFDNEWLNARYHFSFANYMDRDRMGIGPLRVWNDDMIRAGAGFDPHPHRDMEIITYVRSGAVTHLDRLGNRGRTEAGDVQVMSAGRGIVHAEYNQEAEPTTLFQIWILPDRAGHEPGWAQRRFPGRSRAGRLVTLASGRAADRPAEGEEGPLPIHQDAALFGGFLRAGDTVTHRLGRDRLAYLVPATGALQIDGLKVGARDGVAVADMDELTITALEDSELVLADLP